MDMEEAQPIYICIDASRPIKAVVYGSCYFKEGDRFEWANRIFEVLDIHLTTGGKQYQVTEVY